MDVPLRVLGRAVVRPPARSAASLETYVTTAIVSAATRVGVRHLLSAPDIVVDEAGATGEEALASVRAQPPHVLLLDDEVSSPDALEVVSRLTAEAPDVRILLMSATTTAEVPTRAVELGAAGHVDARADAAELQAAVRAVRRGERYFSAVMREALASQAWSGASANPSGLTAREFQVLRLIARGESVAGIEAALGISRSTVHTYKSQIREKLGLTSDVALARYAQHRGIT